MIRRRAVVHGNVQGVFFRDSARRQAESLGVAGWITNKPDGSVEAVFEGDPAEVESMLRFCRAGPGRADVERVEVSEEEAQELEGFAIR